MSSQKKPLTYDETLRLRRLHIGASCPLFFSQQPLKIVRARGQYMYDEQDNRYLDCINNVAHVGHCHPQVVAAETAQAAVLNTNSRFLNDNLVLYAEKLTSLFPEPLSVCFFVNSGSEANDLALQLAKCHTKRDNVITVDHAYHGHLSDVLAISPYKYNKRSDYKLPSWVHVAPSPDSYRGKYTSETYSDEDLGRLYSDEVNKLIEKMDGKVAAYIVESLQSCAGQVMLPTGYLRQVYKYVRDAGGVCIADEVQVGFGRVGTHWWAFQMQGDDIVPDIVTLGKPMGNGHPTSAVVTTPEIAASFYAVQEDWFSTFGGNPVSSAIGSAVIDVIESENLIEHARKVGLYLLELLEPLRSKHKLIGDIRGYGLFVGIELVTDRTTKDPATEQAKYVLAQMKSKFIILSRDGPHENVLKLKPPMPFSNEDAEYFVKTLDDILTQM
ncbi:ethanolamine-phosphate phospho-lyase [Planococcus citri]|uniref:ethanolamine-phosphate phospho-lyase n=1 Tax=Planococcus citri TaxID=170843 RepID=UPI0031F876A6